MNKVDFLIIGGSAAGTTAAEVIRGLKPEASITIVSAENHEQYSRVLLPYYTRGKIAREQVFLKKPEWYIQKSIGFIKGVWAVDLNWSKHIVTLSDGSVCEYGKLLLAIGGDVVKLNVPGAESEKLLYMRTIEDGDAIVKHTATAKKALIVGGGFVSLDLATSFRARGVEDITILVKEPYFWSGKLDRDSSKVLLDVLKKNAVNVEVNEQTAEIKWEGAGGVLITKSSRQFAFDVIGVGIGIKSSTEWLSGAGLKVDKAIITNEYLETNLQDVYAAGDCAQFHDVIFETNHAVGNWTNATSQGSAVGKTMAGIKTLFETTSSYSDTFFEGSYSFIGVTSSDFADEIVCRGSVSEGRMTKIYIKKIGGIMRIVGATVINQAAEVAPITFAIKNKVDISNMAGRISDIDFDLKNLI